MALCLFIVSKELCQCQPIPLVAALESSYSNALCVDWSHFLHSAYACTLSNEVAATSVSVFPTLSVSLDIGPDKSYTCIPWKLVCMCGRNYSCLCLPWQTRIFFECLDICIWWYHVSACWVSDSTYGMSRPCGPLMLGVLWDIFMLLWAYTYYFRLCFWS